MLEKSLVKSLREEMALSEDKIEVVVFGYRLFIYSCLGYVFIALFAYLFGTLAATLTAAITASAFRVFSGGVHASSQKRCIIMGTVIFNILGLISTRCYELTSLSFLRGLSFLIFVIAFFTFIFYAPADTPGKPITTQVQRNRLKGLSIALLILWLVLLNFVFKGETNTERLYILASVLGLAWQSVGLWPITYKALYKR